MEDVQNISLDFLNIKRNQYIKTKQYDVGREIVFCITNEGREFDLTGLTATFSIRNRYGNIVLDSTEADELTVNTTDNRIHLILTEELTAHYGKLPYQISLRDGDTVVSTVTGFMMVAESVRNVDLPPIPPEPPEPPTPPEPPEPPTPTVTHQWDFRVSMTDSIGGQTLIIGDFPPDPGSQEWIQTAVERVDGVGLVVSEIDSGGSLPIVRIPTNLLEPGHMVEIEFGECEMVYSDYGSYYIGTYCDHEWAPGISDVLDVHMGTDEPIYVSCGSYNSTTYDRTVSSARDENYFSNSTLKIVSITSPDTQQNQILDPSTLPEGCSSADYFANYVNFGVKWEIYKNDVLVGITPEMFETSDSYETMQKQGYPELNRTTRKFFGYFNDDHDIDPNVSFCIPANCMSMVIKTMKVY